MSNSALFGIIMMAIVTLFRVHHPFHLDDHDHDHDGDGPEPRKRRNI